MSSGAADGVSGTSATASEASKRYFCHQCDRTVSLNPSSGISCPRCDGEFLEEFDIPSPNPLPLPGFHGAFELISTALAAALVPEPHPAADSPAAGRDIHQPFDPFIFLEEYIASIAGGVEVAVDGAARGAAFGDYFLGPGLERLIEQLAENDPNRYGTPPASKSAVEALLDVEITEDLQLGADESQCAVCMDDFIPGEVTKRMPCQHVFHKGCILPWLELHCSCPVCRSELQTDDHEYECRRVRDSRLEGVSVSSGIGLAAAVGDAGLQTENRTGAVERRLRVSLPPRGNDAESSLSRTGGGESRQDGSQRETNARD